MHSIKEKEVNFFKKERQPGSVDSDSFDESQVPVQLKKIMDHLGFLEKKLDTLLEQSRGRGDSRPGFGNRNFSNHRPGGYRPNNRPGFGGHRSGASDDNRGNRYEGNRPARPGSHSGRPYQKKFTPHSSHASHTPHAAQGNTRDQ